MSDVLNFYKSELDSYDIVRRVAAASNTKLVLKSLMNSGNVDVGLQFLEEFVNTARDDEVLRNIARDVGQIDISAQQFHIAVRVLEIISKADEILVREEAVKSILKLAKETPDGCLATLPVIFRLASDEWFSPRVSACALFADVYSWCKPQQQESLRRLFLNLANDETPMVCRGLARSIKHVFSVTPKADIVRDYLLVLNKFCYDETQELIRCKSIESIEVLCKIFSVDELNTYIMPLIVHAVQDTSWSVRQSVVSIFSSLCGAFGTQQTETRIVEIYMKLLTDPECEVKESAILLLSELVDVSAFSVDLFCRMIIPQLKLIKTEYGRTEPKVAVAKIIGNICKYIGVENTEKILLDDMIDWLNDDNPDVRMNIVANLGLISNGISSESLKNRIAPRVQTLFSDPNWRIRQSVVSQMSSIASSSGVQLFENLFEQLLLYSLTDNVSVVRSTAVTQLGEIGGCFGQDWVIQHLLQKVKDLLIHLANGDLNAPVAKGLNTRLCVSGSSYNIRITCVYTLSALSNNLSTNQIKTYIVPLILKNCSDNVPNVRFTAVNIIEKFIKEQKLATNSAVNTVLSTLSSDPDLDVRFFAARALQELEHK